MLEQAACRWVIYSGAIAAMVGCRTTDADAPATPPTPAPVVAVTTVSATRLEITEDLPGRVVAFRVAEVRPQVSGIVQRRLFEQGTEVRAGQALFQIDPAPFKADLETAVASLQRTESVLARARSQTSRLQPLAEAEAVSGQVLDDAVAQRDQAAADVAQARATLARRQLDVRHAMITAPIAGRIDQALVTEGALVGSSDSTPLARIQQIDQVYVDVRRPASALEAIQEAVSAQRGPVGQSKGLQVTVLRGDGRSHDVKGRVLFAGISVDAGTGDVLLRVLVDNPQRQLLPGMFVRARVPQASYADALTVPQQAVVRAAGQSHVWTLDPKGQAYRKAVDLGEQIGHSYRVRTGITAGQKIVVEGMERLTDGMAVSAKPWTPAESDSPMAPAPSAPASGR